MTLYKKGMLKSYKTAQITLDHGVRCTINIPHEYPLHHHDYYELEIVTEGELLHECNGRSSKLTKGDVYILSPNDVHRLSPLKKTTIYNLCIYPEQCDKSVARLLREEAHPRFGRLTDEGLAEIVALHDALREEICRSDRYREMRISALTTLLASSLLRETTVQETPQTNQVYTVISQAMSYIEDNLTRPISLTDVATASGYSRTYFSKLFKEIVGINFKDYLEMERINLACELLMNKKMSVTEISYAVGFNNFSSFWRAFKKHKCIAPSHYRRQ